MNAPSPHVRGCSTHCRRQRPSIADPLRSKIMAYYAISYTHGSRVAIGSNHTDQVYRFESAAARDVWVQAGNRLHGPDEREALDDEASAVRMALELSKLGLTWPISI